MDALQQKAHLARLDEMLRKPHRDESDELEAGKLALALLEDFLTDHKRQTELLERIANTAEFFEIQRREGR